MNGRDPSVTRRLRQRLISRLAERVAPPKRSLAGPRDVDLVRTQYRESERQFRALLESLPMVAIQGYDRDWRVIYWNDASTRLYGYTPEEAHGRPLQDLIIPPELREWTDEARRAWLEDGRGIPSGELELRHRNGDPVEVYSHHVMLNGHTDDPVMFCVDVDLSEQKRVYRQLDFATRFDRLTHLLNRHGFEEDLEVSLSECRRDGTNLVLVYLDLDHFAEVNEALGYSQGDRLLGEVACRLDGNRRADDILARVSSDEFVLAFPGIRDPESIPRLVQKVEEVMRAPFPLGGRSMRLTACLGVAIFPDNGETGRELIRNADVAKSRAKLDEQARVVYFNQQLQDEMVHRLRLVDRLERGLEEGEFVLYYQPQVSASTGRTANLEALLRWIPVEGPSMSPGEFIPLAEQSDLIHRIGDWVIEEACRQRAAWRDAGLGLQRIDINFSGRQMRKADLLPRFRASVERHGLNPEDIGIELTENVLIDSDEETLAALRDLRHRGFHIGIDDFGTGYSSLSYLKHFPVTSLKIDQSFVRDAPRWPEDRAIMEAAVFIGHRLGLEVVAEGVETREHLDLVREMQIDLVQGFHFFRPMPAAEVASLLTATGRRIGGLSS